MVLQTRRMHSLWMQVNNMITMETALVIMLMMMMMMMEFLMMRTLTKTK